MANQLQYSLAKAVVTARQKPRREGLNLTDVKRRLERGAMALMVIDERRRQTQDPGLGAAAERFIVERELKELADEMLAAARDTTTEIRLEKRHPVLLATAGRWFRKQSR